MTAWPPPGTTLVAPAGLDVTDRPRWLALRREGLGGTDLAPLLGLDVDAKGQPRRSRWQVWLDKTGQLPDEPLTDAAAEWIEWGHVMEPVMVSVWRKRYGIPGRAMRCGMLARVDRPWMRVNLDRRLVRCGLGRGPCLVECKNRSAWQGAQWGATADDVPDAPAVQTQWGLAVTGYSHAHLLAVIGGNTLRHYVIDADAELQATLAEEGSWFWHQYVLPRRMPPVDASERTGRILARLWGVDPAKSVTADAGLTKLHAALEAAQVAASGSSTELDAITHQVQAAMGDAEAIVDGNGRPLVTWKQNGTLRLKDLRRDHPEVVARYSVPATTLDTDKLAAEEPALYAQYRARRFDVKHPPKEDAPHG